MFQSRFSRTYLRLFNALHNGGSLPFSLSLLLTVPSMDALECGDKALGSSDQHGRWRCHPNFDSRPRSSKMLQNNSKCHVTNWDLSLTKLRFVTDQIDININNISNVWICNWKIYVFYFCLEYENYFSLTQWCLLWWTDPSFRVVLMICLRLFKHKHPITGAVRERATPGH